MVGERPWVEGFINESPYMNFAPWEFKKKKFNTTCALKEVTKLMEMNIKYVKSKSEAEVSCAECLGAS